MKKQLLLILSLFVLQTGLADESYNTNGDFTLDYSLNGHGDPNFAELLDSAGLGAQSVLAGMDFDGDGLGEILFSIVSEICSIWYRKYALIRSNFIEKNHLDTHHNLL